jgi:FkbM family methyltransferase
MTNPLRRLARTVAVHLEGYPEANRLLKAAFLKVPRSLRGPQMIHDHLTELSRSLVDPVFCLVGANDGITNDHLFPFARRGRWRGIAIEPVPACFAELERAYAGLPVKRFNEAVHETERVAEFHYLDPAKVTLPAWAKGVGSFDPARLGIVDELPGAAGAITRTRVPCRRLEEIVGDSGFSKIDLFVIDTEGYDAAVVRQIRFEEWEVRTVIFEHKLLPEPELDACRRLLERHGFSLRMDEYDALATR